MIGIGIDTGGTYTDGVIFDFEANTVLANCKRPTTKGNLSVGIGNVIDAFPRELVEKAEIAALSTTLATNACVEDKGGRAKLLLIGSNDEVLHRINAPEKYGLAYSRVLTLEGAGSFDGTVVDMPDWEELAKRHGSFLSSADALAIVEIYAVRNGAIVERTGAQFLRERYKVPVITGASLAPDLNMMERGATALLNARLLPVIEEFLAAMKTALHERELDLPIMIVRSDGSLMSEDLAQERPVETILSGPAASVGGAQSLADAPDCLIVDMGGTTTDIAIVRDDDPVMTTGIRIGGWATQIRGVYIDTLGLGGDSAVTFATGGGIDLSARRVLPLCMAADRWPEIVDKLREVIRIGSANRIPRHEFYYFVREPSNYASLSDNEKRLLELTRQGPISRADSRIDWYALRRSTLEDDEVVMRAGFTPTDAMHIKGDFDRFDASASKLGAQYFLMCEDLQRASGSEGSSEDMDKRCLEFANRVYERVEHKLYLQIIRTCLAQRFPSMKSEDFGKQFWNMVEDSWSAHVNGDAVNHLIDFTISMRPALVGVGAPTHLFIPEVARALKTSYIIPEDAGVANAVGAVLARISVSETCDILPLRSSYGEITGYHVNSPEYTQVFEDLEDARAAAAKEAERLARVEASKRGAGSNVVVEVKATEEILRAANGTEVPYVWSYTARVRTKDRRG